MTSQPTGDVTIGVGSSDTSEGTVSPASVTFSANTWNTVLTITVTGANDDFYDGNVGYAILLTAATSADAKYNGLKAADVSVANTDNDSAGITVSPSGGLKTTEAGGTASLTVALTAQPVANGVLIVTSGDTGEATLNPAVLTFTPAWLESLAWSPDGQRRTGISQGLQERAAVGDAGWLPEHLADLRPGSRNDPDADPCRCERRALPAGAQPNALPGA